MCVKYVQIFKTYMINWNVVEARYIMIYRLIYSSVFLLVIGSCCFRTSNPCCLPMKSWLLNSITNGCEIYIYIHIYIYTLNYMQHSLHYSHLQIYTYLYM